MKTNFMLNALLDLAFDMDVMTHMFLQHDMNEAISFLLLCGNPNHTFYLIA